MELVQEPLVDEPPTDPLKVIADLKKDLWLKKRDFKAAEKAYQEEKDKYSALQSPKSIDLNALK